MSSGGFGPGSGVGVGARGVGVGAELTGGSESPPLSSRAEGGVGIGAGVLGGKAVGVTAGVGVVVIEGAGEGLAAGAGVATTTGGVAVTVNSGALSESGPWADPPGWSSVALTSKAKMLNDVTGAVIFLEVGQNRVRNL